MFSFSISCGAGLRIYHHGRKYKERKWSGVVPTLGQTSSNLTGKAEAKAETHSQNTRCRKRPKLQRNHTQPKPSQLACEPKLLLAQSRSAHYTPVKVIRATVAQVVSPRPSGTAHTTAVTGGIPAIKVVKNRMTPPISAEINRGVPTVAVSPQKTIR
jgi:hypothetical protein